MNKTYTPVATSQDLAEAIARCREAQKKYATFTQEQVNRIFLVD